VSNSQFEEGLLRLQHNQPTGTIKISLSKPDLDLGDQVTEEAWCDRKGLTSGYSRLSYTYKALKSRVIAPMIFTSVVAPQPTSAASPYEVTAPGPLIDLPPGQSL
jgi:hypothetical protein